MECGSRSHCKAAILANVGFGSKASFLTSVAMSALPPKATKKATGGRATLISTRERGVELTCERGLHWECQLGGLP